MRYLLIGFAILLTGCAATTQEAEKAIYGVSQNEVDALDHICTKQVTVASQRNELNRWSEWAKCKKRHVMPAEMKIYNVKVSEIAPVYDNMISRLQTLEKEKAHSSRQASFQIQLDKIYDLYDQEKAAIGFNICEKWVDTKDNSGSKVCAR